LCKDTVQSVLKAFDYRIAYSPKGCITGLSFTEDVKLLVSIDDPVCFDVGANEGQTIELFQTVFKNPRIYAFEPSSETFGKLKLRNYGSHVSIHNFALGSKDSRQEFLNYEDPCFSSFLVMDPNPGNRFRGMRVKTSEAVDVRTIDHFIQQNQVNRIDLLKIDTQGYDLKVLIGAADALERGLINNIFIELNFDRFYRDQGDPRQISDLLAEHDFDLVDLYDKFRCGHRLEWCNALYSLRRLDGWFAREAR